MMERPVLIVVAGLEGREISCHKLEVGGNLARQIMDVSSDRFGGASIYVFRNNLNGENLINTDIIPTICVEAHDFYVLRATPAQQAIVPIFAIAAVAALTFFTAGMGAALLVGAIGVATYIAASALIPTIKPPTPEAARDQASGLNTLGLPSNLARLGSRIPEIFGRMRFYPDLAIPPIEEWSGRNQSVTTLYTVGIGFYDVTSFKLGETLISSTLGVAVDVYHPNFTMPPMAIVRQVESTRQIDLKVTGDTPNAVGTFTPWVVVVGDNVTKLWIDIAFPSGLILYNNNGDGSTNFERVVIRVEYQRIDVPGLAVHTQDITFQEESKDPLRFTTKITTPSAGEYRLRVKRMDNGRAANGISARINTCSLVKVAGEEPLPLFCRATRTRTMIRLTIDNNDEVAQLSSLTFNCVVTRNLKQVQSNGTLAVSTVPTRHMVDALAYCLYEPTLGGFDLEDLDLQGFWNVNATLATLDGSEGREFNGVFDRFISVDEMAQAIATIGRCGVCYDGGRIILLRDQAQPAPVSLFNRRVRSASDQSTRVSTFILPFDDDGVSIDWFDEDNRWVQRTYTYPTNAINPRKVDLVGATHWSQIYRRAVYEYLRIQYRRRSYRIQVTEEGAIVNPMDVVCVIDPWIDAIFDGDVLDYDTTTRTVKLDKTIDVPFGAVFRVRDIFATQIDDVPLASYDSPADTVVLARAPVFPLFSRDFNRQVGCLYAVHLPSEFDIREWQVLEVVTNDRKIVELNMIEYSPEVFACDTVSLPAAPALH